MVLRNLWKSLHDAIFIPFLAYTLEYGNVKEKDEETHKRLYLENKNYNQIKNIFLTVK